VLPILNFTFDAGKDLFQATITLSEGLKKILILGVVFPEMYPCGGWTMKVCEKRTIGIDIQKKKKKINVLLEVKLFIFILYSLYSENILSISRELFFEIEE